MRRTFEEMLVGQCAPTLAGIKPANLFRFRAESAAAGRSLAEFWHRKLEPFGLAIRVLKECPEDAACVICVDREDWVRQLLRNRENAAFLSGRGYRVSADVERVLGQFAARLRTGDPYPHEIGILLGYPLTDVIGFVENGGGRFACCGCWKAYGEPEAARRYFACCRRCTEACMELYRSGVPVLRLVARV